MTLGDPFSAIASTSTPGTTNNTPQWRRFPQVRPRQIVRMAASTLTAIRYLPIFTPRQTLTRWRSKRALRAAAREAKRGRKDRDWTDRFKLNGLTWHHLYIAQDLRRIQLVLRELEGRMIKGDDDSVAKGLVKVERSYRYLLDNVWDVYNTLERQVFFPWIEGACQEEAAIGRALMLFGKERSRIEDVADNVSSRFSRMVCSTGFPYSSLGSCSLGRRLNAARVRKEKRRKERQAAKSRAKALSGVAESNVKAREKKEALAMREGYKPEQEKELAVTSLRRINLDELQAINVEVSNLIEDTERLHKMERGLLYPLIAEKFGEKEQSRLTNVMVYSMRSVLAKFIITIYHQAVEKHGTRTQWKYYKREVPLPIRVYTPVWRKRLFDGCPLGHLRQTSLKEFGR